MDWDAKPEVYKEYPSSEAIELPKDVRLGSLPLDQCIHRRRSGRTFSKEPVSSEELSYLLWSVTGISRAERGHEFRTVPSAGALYPIETYVCANNVDGVPPGIYHHNIRRHALELVSPGPAGPKVASAGLDQRMLEESALDIIWTCIFERMRWKYGQRAFRYVNLDVGHMAENLALSCAATGISCCHVAAFYDDEVNALLRLNGDVESAIYMSCVGKPR